MNDKDKVFVDVRTPGEYKARNIRQFKNIPLGSDFSKLPKDKEIVVICQSGMRSSQACKQLKKLGYENSYKCPWWHECLERMSRMKEITVQEVQQRLENGEALNLIDVREVDEVK